MPGPASAQYIMDLESDMRLIQVNEFQRLTEAEFIWWDMVTKRKTSGSRREIMNWILSTALIEDQGEGGQLAYDTMYVQEYDFTHETKGKGLKVRRQQFEDQDGNGVNTALEWTKQISAHGAYWPQQQVASLLNTGESSLAYDKVNYFSINHPSNPYDLTAGYYANIFTGTAGSAGANAADANKALYPGAVNVFTGAGGVTADVALQNLIRGYQYIWEQKMPNGILPRNLSPQLILAPSTLYPSLVQLTNARFIAQAASTGGGSGDVQALISQMGFGMPMLGRDLIDQDAFYVFCKEMQNDELGAFGYSEREPFSIRYYTGRGGGNGVDAILDRLDEFEWHQSGRNKTFYGHPWVCYKFKKA